MQNKFELYENELDEIIKILPQNGVVILKGDLASGKTTLARHIIKQRLGFSEVTSPTFSFMQDYGQIYHYDLYMCGLNGILQNGLFENLLQDGLHLVEWGDEDLKTMLKKYEISVCEVSIVPKNDKRIYEVKFA